MAPIDKLSVVLVAVFGVLFLSEHLALHHWLGVLRRSPPAWFSSRCRERRAIGDAAGEACQA